MEYFGVLFLVSSLIKKLKIFKKCFLVYVNKGIRQKRRTPFIIHKIFSTFFSLKSQLPDQLLLFYHPHG